MQVKKQPKSEYRVILTNADIRRMFRDAIRAATGDVLVLDQDIYVFLAEDNAIPDEEEEWSAEDATCVLQPTCSDDNEVVGLIMTGGSLDAIDVTLAPPTLETESDDPGDVTPARARRPRAAGR